MATIREMHNLFLLKMQKMNSSMYDWIKEEYIDDMFINSSETYVKNRYNSYTQSQKGPFQRNLKHMADIETLIKSKKVVAYLDGDPDYFSLRLPGDFLYPLEFSCDSVDQCVYKTLPATVSDTVYSYKFELPYNVTEIRFNNEAIVTFPGRTNSELSFMNIRELLGKASNTYGDFYVFGQSFEFVSLVDSTLEVVAGESTTNATKSSVSKQKYAQIQDSWNKIRIVSVGEFMHNFEHPFAKSIPNSPMGYIENNILRIHAEKRFLLSNVKMVYVRKLPPVNLSLNVSSELPQHTHSEIVDLAVAEALETIESPRVQTKIILNRINE